MEFAPVFGLMIFRKNHNMLTVNYLKLGTDFDYYLNRKFIKNDNK